MWWGVLYVLVFNVCEDLAQLNEESEYDKIEDFIDYDEESEPIQPEHIHHVRAKRKKDRQGVLTPMADEFNEIGDVTMIVTTSTELYQTISSFSTTASKSVLEDDWKKLSLEELMNVEAKEDKHIDIKSLLKKFKEGTRQEIVRFDKQSATQKETTNSKITANEKTTTYLFASSKRRDTTDTKTFHKNSNKNVDQITWKAIDDYTIIEDSVTRTAQNEEESQSTVKVIAWEVETDKTQITQTQDYRSKQTEELLPSTITTQKDASILQTTFSQLHMSFQPYVRKEKSSSVIPKTYIASRTQNEASISKIPSTYLQITSFQNYVTKEKESTETSTTEATETEEVSAESTIVFPKAPIKMATIKNMVREREETTTVQTRPTVNFDDKKIDVPKLLALLDYVIYDEANRFNLTKKFNESLQKYEIPTCETFPPPTTTTEPPSTINFNDAKVVAKCFVCGLDVKRVPSSSACADAFAGDFIPLVPVDPQARGQISNYRKYCRYLDINRVITTEEEPNSVFGRFTGGCSVRWVDLTSIYTQRSCRNRRRAVLGRHFASKRMAKLEMALKDVDNGCIISPMATLLPLSRGISLYARFHACVCTGSWCNKGISRKNWITNNVLMLIVVIYVNEFIEL